MKAQFTAELEGVFRLETHGATRGYIDHGYVGNKILNSGINRIFTTDGGVNNLFNYLAVGTSSSVVLPTDTQLGSKIAQVVKTGSVVHGYNADEGYGWARSVYAFGIGDAAGNLSEIGVSWLADATTLFSRALITDGAGNPVTITVLPDEYLTVTYEARRYWSVGVPFVMNWTDENGIPTAVTVTPVLTTDTTEDGLGSFPLSSNLTMDTQTANLGVVAKSNAGNTLTFTRRYGLTEKNPALSSVVSSGSRNAGAGALIPKGTLFTFDPPIPKTSDHTIDVTIEVTLVPR